jgi:hypothetical protein
MKMSKAVKRLVDSFHEVGIENANPKDQKNNGIFVK